MEEEEVPDQPVAAIVPAMLPVCRIKVVAHECRHGNLWVPHVAASSCILVYEYSRPRGQSSSGPRYVPARIDAGRVCQWPIIKGRYQEKIMARNDELNSAVESGGPEARNDALSRRRAIGGALGAIASVSMLGDGIKTAAAATAHEPAHLWGPFEAPGADFVFQARVTIAPPIDFGRCSYGVRRIIPITGGDFSGKEISGTVLGEGEDTQLVRPDGVTEICARYTLRTHDGTHLYIVNSGIVVPGSNPHARPSYVRTSPMFEAPLGSRYEWLNKSLFIGTLNPMPPAEHAVIIRVFRVT